MWVRIDEITFAADRADDVIAHTRNNAVASHQGESFLGFRLLVDRAQGSALNVSYWDEPRRCRTQRFRTGDRSAHGGRNRRSCDRICTSWRSTPPDPAAPGHGEWWASSRATDPS